MRKIKNLKIWLVMSVILVAMMSTAVGETLRFSEQVNVWSGPDTQKGPVVAVDCS